MFWRLNFLVFWLMMVHGNTYILYYICPLHTFFFLTVFFALRIMVRGDVLCVTCEVCVCCVFYVYFTVLCMRCVCCLCNNVVWYRAYVERCITYDNALSHPPHTHSRP